MYEISADGVEREVETESELSPRSFTLNKNLRWPNAVVPYVIGPGFNDNQIQKILEGMDKIHRVSCVRWVPRKNEQDFVHIVKIGEPKCYSFVGRLGGRQELVLSDACFNPRMFALGTVTHEMMHSMGFVHEQSRLDRDCYVRVSLQAIRERPSDFGIAPGTDSGTFPYDIKSIMHYPSQRNVLEGKNEPWVGNRDGNLTPMDQMKINYIYCNGPTFCQARPGDCSWMMDTARRCTRNM